MTPETYAEVLAAITATGKTDPANIAQCEACGFRWDDSMSTELTPAPAARCPNEYNHADAWGYKGIDVEQANGGWGARTPWGRLEAGSKRAMRELITRHLAAHGVTGLRKARGRR